MKTIMNKKYRSLDQAKLKIVCDDLCDNIEPLLQNLDLEYSLGTKMVSMCCPIHKGDNPSAVNIYHEGDHYRGNWKCRTHGCESTFKGSIIGFIRGVISSNKYNWTKDGDDSCSFEEALNYCLGFLNKDMKSIKISKSDRNKKIFTSLVNHVKNKSVITANRLTRDFVRQSLRVPAEYFIERGFSKSILDKYDVGFCDKPNKEMYSRAVVPIYDNDYQYVVGCTGRIVFEKCSQCGSFHSSTNRCPNEVDRWKFSKWKHNQDFKSQNHLYNFWFAKKQILESHTVLIVESPGNVWKLEENNIHNSVAIFGSSLSDMQKMILDSSGAMNIVILTDNDEAGKKAAQQIKNKCQNTYRIFIPQISKPDIGDMTTQEIDTEIKQYLGSII